MATLYHYTDAAGLIGILESKSFWASDTRFLNETTEFQYGLNLLASAIKDFKDYLIDASAEAYFLIESLLETEMANAVAFTASFSSKGDASPEWRAYNAEKGFALGIDSDWLNINAIAQGFALVPVIYEAGKQAASAAAVVNFLITRLEDSEGDAGSVHDCVEQWWPQALKAALAFKGSRFEGEEELRLVRVGNALQGGMRIRPGPAGLIPYIPCFFDRQSIKTPNYLPRNFGLEEVIVGPALRDQQLTAVDALLSSQKMKLKVRKSSADAATG